MNKITFENVSKSYGDTQALNHVNLTFEKGKVYGLLGRNGAGKSTLLNILSNRIFKNEGKVSVDGDTELDSDLVQSKIYLMSEHSFYPTGMKMAELFNWISEYYPNFDVDYAHYLIDLFELNTKKRVRENSTGYQSILRIIIALSVNVDYVLFDEPVLGLDANHRQLFYKELIKQIEEGQSTYILSTHLIEEVANIIEEVIIIDKGNVKLNESVESLLSKGYSVSGKRDVVDDYCVGKDVLSTDAIGSLKVAHILGDKELTDGLEFSSLNLQNLFVELTNGGRTYES